DTHAFEGSAKVVSDKLFGEVFSSLQLHRAARTACHAGIQRRLNVRCVVLSVRWCNPNCRASCRGGGWQNQEQPEEAKEKCKPRISPRPSAVHVGHLDFPFRNYLLDGITMAWEPLASGGVAFRDGDCSSGRRRWPQGKYTPTPSGKCCFR